MATEHFLIPKDHFEHLLRKADELERKTVNLEKSPKKISPKESTVVQKNEHEEGESTTKDEYDSSSSTSSDDFDDAAESKSGGGVVLKRNGAHVMSRTGDYEYITYDEYDIDDVKEMFDSCDLVYVEPILEKLERYEDILNWDKETGEILFQKKLILGSNIVELLRDSLSGGLYPKGKIDFYLGLGLINLKAKYIKNVKNKHLLQINSKKGYYSNDWHNEYKQIKKRKWVD